MNILIGILIFVLAGWQFFASYRAFHQVRTTGNASTSPFIGWGLWSGLVFGIILLGAGIRILMMS